MSQKPNQVWQRLSTKQQKEVLTELLNICREIAHEHIKIKTTTSDISPNISVSKNLEITEPI
jgi:hypothetical protein